MSTAIKPLLLAGGRSTRMGSRKELLCLANDIPIYEQQLLRLHHAFPESDAVFLSLPSPASLPEILENPRIERVADTTFRLHTANSSPPFIAHILYDNPGEDLGPAAGLLSAYRHDNSATWLVVACDYPFFPVSALRYLCGHMAGPVTCFENADGIYEPLLGIWTPEALSLLDQNVQRGILGPKAVVLESKGTSIRPESEIWLFNMNTRAEYEQALRMSDEMNNCADNMKAS
ncbi:MobA-like NTP transferase domain-containing protein [Aspergillus pseudodeflectus]|uniref:MobA-like NTP transferase domain-containing protein n=1 Tax=Aspergillus pseudodeflectus TaxID=176178 RepID=A0ABR4JIR7_9EURO